MRACSSGSSMPSGTSTFNRYRLSLGGRGENTSQAAETISLSRHTSVLTERPRPVSTSSCSSCCIRRGRAIDVASQTPHLPGGERSVDQHFCTTVYGSQRIAQIMHDGCGEPADGGDPFPAD